MRFLPVAVALLFVSVLPASAMAGDFGAVLYRDLECSC